MSPHETFDSSKTAPRRITKIARMYTRIIPAVGAALTLFVMPSVARAAALADALDAYRDNHVADAERQLTAVADDDAASDADRAEARRTLGRIDFLVRGETDALEAALAQQVSGDAKCALAITALQSFREAGAPERGLATTEGAASSCVDGNAPTFHVEAARAHLAFAAGNPAQRAEQLRAAAEELAAIDAGDRGAPLVAGARLTLGMMLRDGAAAFNAWRDYYWLTGEEDAPQALGRYVGRVQALLNAGLTQGATDDDILALIEMLNRAGFVADAKQLADDVALAARAGDDRRWRTASALFTFEAAVRADTLRANREIAAGGRGAWYERAIREHMRTLMQSASLSGDPSTTLAEAFGLYGTVGETSGYPSLHGGHIAEDRHMSIEQYGQRGELRFIVIDNMLANGYESWLWDGRAATGGWQSDGAIVQVRSVYTNGPLHVLRRTRPGPARDRFLAAIETDSASERTALGRDGVAELPAQEARLNDQAYQTIAQRTGNDDAAFIAEVWRATNQYSIEKHEGRHAIDKASGRRYSDATLEYQAKLSQIALADYPRLGLANVCGQSQNNTPHGIANRRVLELYRSWMRAHRDEIAGFDDTQPTLSQVHRLSDEQIAAIARGADPLALGAPIRR